MKVFTGLDRVRIRKENNVETYVVLSAVVLVAASLIVQRQGKAGLIRSPEPADLTGIGTSKKDDRRLRGVNLWHCNPCCDRYQLRCIRKSSDRHK